MPRAQHISMTRRAYTRLKNELGALCGRPRREAPNDWMYTDEGRDDYRAQRSRMAIIEKLFADAIVDNTADDATATPGSVVTVRYDTGDTETFVLGGHGAGDEDNKIYPLRSPLGRAVAGARPGQHRTYTLPGGRSIGMTLLNIEPAAQSAKAKHRSPLTVAHSRRGRPHPPGATAAGLRELLSAPRSESKYHGTPTVPRVRAALHPSITNAVRTSVCGAFERQASN